MAQQLNLFNPIFLKQKKYFSALTMLQALGLVVAGVVAFYGYAAYESRSQARIAADASRQLDSQTAQLTALTREYSPQGRSKLLQEELSRADARLRQREEMLALLQTGGLGNTAGFARYLSALARQSVGGVWLTGVSISGDEAELNLSGRVLQADLVPTYIRALNREEVMRGRRIAELRLTGREEREASTAGAGQLSAASITPAARPPAGPTPYVEFSLIALRSPGAPDSAQKGAQ